ncbi:MAG: response regulator [Bariatricus sp.]
MKVICVDDEMMALENFSMKAEGIPGIESLKLFRDGEKALNWAKDHEVDAAFLDIEMRDINGIELAKKLKTIDKNIRVIFVTAYSQYALDAFGVDAIGYILKPFTREELAKELEKAALVKPRPRKRVQIHTIPHFSVSVDEEILSLGREKIVELLALLVDRGSAGLTSGEAIACLWPERPADENTRTLYRVTFHRLMEALKKAGIEHIISADGRRKYICRDRVECDLYQILEGDRQAISNYVGYYLKEYSWAEIRNGQLSSMKEAAQQIDTVSGRQNM